MKESDIVIALQQKLASKPANSNAAFIREFFVDKFARRADLVLANGKLSAFEIKSKCDNLDRLNGQLDVYCRFFESVTVVCAVKHLEGVLCKAPEDVGVWTVSDEGKFITVRSAKSKKIKSYEVWLSFLPVYELRFLLKKYELSARGDRNDLVSACGFIDLNKVRDFVLGYLKRRHLNIDALRKKRAATRVLMLERKANAKIALARIDFSDSDKFSVPAIPRLKRL